MRKRENDKRVGEKINKWTIEGYEIGKKGIEWICRCECGEVRKQKVWNVVSGRSKMCKACSVKQRREERIILDEKCEAQKERKSRWI